MRAYGWVGAGLLALGVGAWPVAAQQASTMTYVISTGTDTGSCPRTAPCHTFRYAITQTPAGGEIVALDVAGYGPFTIDRAITISFGGPGRAYVNGIYSQTGGIAINAGSGDAVHLRGLQVVGGKYGIVVNSAGSLELTDVTVSGASNTGLYVVGATNVVMSRSMFTGNSTGVNAAQGSLVMRDVRVSNGSSGILAAVNAYLVKCTVENQSVGVHVSSGATFVKGSIVTQNSQGLQVDAGGTLNLDTTTVTGNTTGVNVSGGTANSYGDNNITDNIAGTITQVPRN